MVTSFLPRRRVRTASEVAVATAACLVGALALGCASPTAASKIVSDSVTVDPANAKVIRFVVNGDPGLAKYPAIQAMSIPVHEKIREGMRRYAADVLAERGLCPKGFVGPEVVWAYERSRL